MPVACALPVVASITHTHVYLLLHCLQVVVVVIVPKLSTVNPAMLLTLPCLCPVLVSARSLLPHLLCALCLLVLLRRCLLLVHIMDFSFGKRSASERSPHHGPASSKQSRKEDEDHVPNRRQQESSDRKQIKVLKMMVIAIGALSLTLARELAIVRSILVSVTLALNSLTSIADSVKTATTRYAAQLKNTPASDKAEMPSPHIVAWGALLEDEPISKLQPVIDHILDIQTQAKPIHDAAVTQLDTPPDEEAAKIMLSREKAKIIAKILFVRRVVKCYDPAKCRVELACKEGSSASLAKTAIMQHLEVNCKGQVKPGQAPKGKLERRIEKWLAQFRNMKDSDMPDIDLEADLAEALSSDKK